MSDEVPDEVINKILEQAATDLGVDAGELSVAKASRVVWRDSSLGCPKPGQVYMQVLTDGYWVILNGPDGQIDYRASLEGSVVTCEEGQEPLTDDEDLS